MGLTYLVISHFFKMVSCSSCVLDLRLFGGWVGKERERIEIRKENGERGRRSRGGGGRWRVKLEVFFHKVYILKYVFLFNSHDVVSLDM